MEVTLHKGQHCYEPTWSRESQVSHPGWHCHGSLVHVSPQAFAHPFLALIVSVPTCPIRKVLEDFPSGIPQPVPESKNSSSTSHYLLGPLGTERSGLLRWLKLPQSGQIKRCPSATRVRVGPSFGERHAEAGGDDVPCNPKPC